MILDNISGKNKDLTTLIKEAAQQQPSKNTDINTIADEVIAGKWGKGSERKERLEAAGYDYNEVQTLANSIAPDRLEKLEQKMRNDASIINNAISELNNIIEQLESLRYRTDINGTIKYRVSVDIKSQSSNEINSEIKGKVKI